MEVVALRRERVVATIPVRARLERQPVTAVHAPVAGRVVALHVAPGATVIAGAPLARLDAGSAGALVVRAPVAGLVAHVDVAVGELLRDARARLLVALAALSPLALEAEATSVAVREAHAGGRALLVALGIAGPRDARLVAAADAPEGPLAALVDNDDLALVPPFAAELRLLADDDAVATLLVPSRALVPTPAGPVLYVELAPGRYVRRLVEVREDDGVVAQVGRGVHAGTRVLRDGAGILTER